MLTKRIAISLVLVSGFTLQSAPAQDSATTPAVTPSVTPAATPAAAPGATIAPSCEPPEGLPDQAPPGERHVVPGPLAGKRALLFLKIQEAGKRGVGTSAYMSAFNAIEKSVGEGQSDAAISPQIDRLYRALDEQKQNSMSPSSRGAYQDGRMLGRLVGAELRVKYGGIPGDADLSREFANPAFTKRIRDGFIASMKKNHPDKQFSPAEIKEAEAAFNQQWPSRVVAMKRQLAILRRMSQGR